MGICAAFHKFYYEQRIMADDETVRQARLTLTDATPQGHRHRAEPAGDRRAERM
jgi:hypothetical protein